MYSLILLWKQQIQANASSLKPDPGNAISDFDAKEEKQGPFIPQTALVTNTDLRGDTSSCC